MSRLPDYTPLELLLLFRFIAKNGSQASAIEQVSRLLAFNTSIQQDPSFSLQRLQPAVLAETYKILKNGEPGDRDGRGSTSPLKRGISSPPKRAQNMPRSIEEISIDLYARYKVQAVASIREDEKEITKLRGEIAEIEKGEWDERLQLQSPGRSLASAGEDIKSLGRSPAHKQDTPIERPSTSNQRSPIQQQHGRSISIADLLSHDSTPSKAPIVQSESAPLQLPAPPYSFQQSPPLQRLPSLPDHPSGTRHVPTPLSLQTATAKPQLSGVYERTDQGSSFPAISSQPSARFHPPSARQYPPSFSRMLPNPVNNTNGHSSSRSSFSPGYPVQHYPPVSPYASNGHPTHHAPFLSPRTPAPFQGYPEQSGRTVRASDPQIRPPSTPVVPPLVQRPRVEETEVAGLRTSGISNTHPPFLTNRGSSKVVEIPSQTPKSPVPPAPEDFSPISEQDTPDVTLVGTLSFQEDSLRSSVPSTPTEQPASPDQSSTGTRWRTEPRPHLEQRVTHGSTITASRNLQRTSGPLLSDIGQHRFASLFAAPVRVRDAPGYVDVVYRPQDFKSIRSAVSFGGRALANLTVASEQADDTEPDAPITLDRSTLTAKLPNSEEWKPPKSIVTAAQLEMEVSRVFANAVMFNSEATPSFAYVEARMHGRGSMMVERSSRTGLEVDRNPGDEPAEDKRPGYDESDGAMVEDTKQMWQSTRRLFEEWSTIGR